MYVFATLIILKLKIVDMAKLYTSKKDMLIECTEPKKETLQFLLNYSKALHIVNHEKLQFENVLN